MKNKKYSFVLNQLEKKWVFSFAILKPAYGYFSVELGINQRRWQIAHLGMNQQMMYSIRENFFTYEIDTLSFSTFDGVTEIEVIVTAHEGADLCDVHGVSISERVSQPYLKGKNRPLKPVQQIAQYIVPHQEAARICMPCSVIHAASILKKNKLMLEKCMESCFDSQHKIYGNWTLATYAFYQLASAGYQMKVCFLEGISTLESLLSIGFPICVSVKGELKGAKKVFEDGHLMTVIGMDEAFVICLDSAQDKIEDVVKRYEKKAFVQAWQMRDNLAFVIEKKSEFIKIRS